MKGGWRYAALLPSWGRMSLPRWGGGSGTLVGETRLPGDHRAKSLTPLFMPLFDCDRGRMCRQYANGDGCQRLFAGRVKGWAEEQDQRQRDEAREDPIGLKGAITERLAEKKTMSSCFDQFLQIIVKTYNNSQAKPVQEACCKSNDLCDKMRLSKDYLDTHFPKATVFAARAHATRLLWS